MNIQKIAFMGKKSSVNTKENDARSNSDKKVRNGNKKLKRTLVALGIIAAAGIGIEAARRKGIKVEKIKQTISTSVAGVVGSGIGIVVYKLNKEDENKLNKEEVSELNTDKQAENTETGKSDTLPKSSDLFPVDMPEGLSDREIEAETAVHESPEDIDNYIQELQKLNEVQDEGNLCYNDNQSIDEELQNEAAQDLVIPDALPEVDAGSEMVMENPFNSKKVKIAQNGVSYDDLANLALEYQNRYDKLEADFKSRLENNIKLDDRIKEIKEKHKADTEEFKVSFVKTMQLRTFSDKKICALDDQLLEYMLDKSNGKIYNIDFIKKIPSQQLIRVQANPQKRSALYNIIDGHTDKYGFVFETVLSE